MRSSFYKIALAVDIVLLGVLACSTEVFPAPEPLAAPTEPPTEPATQELALTEAPIVTDVPISTEPPLACVTLLAPENGADLPPTGKVTFSWTPMDGSRKLCFEYHPSFRRNRDL